MAEVNIPVPDVVPVPETIHRVANEFEAAAEMLRYVPVPVPFTSMPSHPESGVSRPIWLFVLTQ